MHATPALAKARRNKTEEAPLEDRWAAAAAAPPDEREVAEVKAAVLAKLALAVGKDPSLASPRDWYVATALTIRDRLVHRWLEVDRAHHSAGRKRVYYLSLEFLIGRLLGDVLGNLGLTPVFHAALGDLGVDLNRLRAAEPDAALGNGGLGRLAACFMDSMASLGIPACGYGIRYDHGLFRQVIRDGRQQEFPEKWLAFGNPWEFARPEVTYDICFGGTVEERVSAKGGRRMIWRPAETIAAVAYDTPIPGWGGRHVNPLRLWSARAADPLRLDTFNSGDHVGALSEQARAEAISKVLYPSDETPAGRDLRLRQEYFFASASLQDLVSRHLRAHGELDSVPDCTAIQLNDTHPSIAVAELMRLLVDIHSMDWDHAWDITVRTFSYTNHTLLPEALETWPVSLLEALLPRHLQIIYRINAQHLETLKRAGDVPEHELAAVSVIDENHGRRVRMGHLAFIGSHRVNGVSALHTELMRQTVFKELHAIHPTRITNKTNGITFRRWLFQANPRLTQLLVSACGDDIFTDSTALSRSAAFADDSAFQQHVSAAKRANKIALARMIRDRTGALVDPDALFDVQIKRFHEYKRQLLNVVETVALYQAMRDDPTGDWAPRVKIFSGKAAASYRQAKLIIQLINDVAEVVNNDPVVGDLLKVAFVPDYNVSVAERIIPAADVSEQISTAGMEASGTGNMKLALNGALTIGTLDGANVEIQERVGEDNIFIFGLLAAEVADRRRRGLDAGLLIAMSPRLGRAIEAIATGEFSPDEPDRFLPLTNALQYSDFYMVTADFDAYYETQRRIDGLWHLKAEWARASILNIANMGWFSSDRTISQYASDIWNVPVDPVGRGRVPAPGVEAAGRKLDARIALASG